MKNFLQLFVAATAAVCAGNAMATEFTEICANHSADYFGVKPDPRCNPFDISNTYVQMVAANTASSHNAQVGDIIDVQGDGGTQCLYRDIVWQVNHSPVNYNYAYLTYQFTACVH